MANVLVVILSFFYFLIISLAGIKVFAFVTQKQNKYIEIPAGILTGLAVSIFLVNFYACISSGYVLVALLIITHVLVIFLLRKQSFFLPKNKIYWVSAILWFVVLFFISRSARIDGGDSTIHYSIASVFARGDFPTHSPWQPEYIALYHTGWAQFFGITRLATSTNFTFIQAFVGFLVSWSISQILTFGFIKELKKVLTIFIPAIFGLLTLGGIMIAIPQLKGDLFSGDFIKWVLLQPTLVNSFEVFGSPVDIDALFYFFHRLLSLSFLFVLITLVLNKVPNNKIPKLILIGTILSSIALVDESVFVVSFPVMLIYIFFSLLQRSIIKTTIFATLTIVVIGTQGGFITETLINRYHEPSSILIFPSDAEERGLGYRTYRINQQKAKFFTFDDNENYNTFSYIHLGLTWQLLATLVISLLSRENNRTISLFLLLSIVSYICFFVIVPKGMYHANGNRFLTMSFYFSGIAIAMFIRDRLNKKFTFINLFVIWVLIWSTLPPIAKMISNRPNANWFNQINRREHTELEKWIVKNTDVSDNILVLNDTIPVNSGNIELVREVGAMTPVWSYDVRSYDSFDTSPIFSDVFYTLNPNLLNELNVKYLVINDNYLKSLKPERIKDLNNSEYFYKAYEVPLSFDSRSTRILKIRDMYLENAENFGGTFKELAIVAPKDGTYFIDYPPNITEGVFRILLLTLKDHEIYYNTAGAFYNSRLSVDAPYYGNFDKEKYDYYLLGKNVNAEEICNCRSPKLLWEGLGNSVNLWGSH